MNTYKILGADGSKYYEVKAEKVMIKDGLICLYNEIPRDADVDIVAVFPKEYIVIKRQKIG